MAIQRGHLRSVDSEPGGDRSDGARTAADAFRLYAPYVARIGVRLLGRDHEVDDLVQEVFLAAMRGLSQLREPAAVRAWLATVAVRIARRKLRLRRVRVWLGWDELTAQDFERIVSPDTDPADRALLAQLYAVLDELPVNERIAWTLHHVEGETLEQVARWCGCSLATAKRRIAAAHSAIAKAVDRA